ncbi:hypothetical protein lerEdw1_006024 [Lerista edwardsae]|nr:hypothetical protein lerEdw1_006024 [Lerista edwardsae]
MPLPVSLAECLLSIPELLSRLLQEEALSAPGILSPAGNGNSQVEGTLRPKLGEGVSDALQPPGPASDLSRGTCLPHSRTARKGPRRPISQARQKPAGAGQQNVKENTQKPKSRKREKPYKCPKCQRRFMGRLALTAHRRLHIRKWPRICPQSGARPSHTPDSVVPQEGQLGAGASPLPCSQGEGTLPFWPEMALHQQAPVAHSFNPWSLGYGPQPLPGHQAPGMHSNGEFICDQCGWSFHGWEELVTHQMAHMAAAEGIAGSGALTVHQKSGHSEVEFLGMGTSGEVGCPPLGQPGGLDPLASNSQDTFQLPGHLWSEQNDGDEQPVLIVEPGTRPQALSQTKKGVFWKPEVCTISRSNSAGDDGPMEGDKDEAALPDQGSPPADWPFPFPTWEESSGDENVLVIHSQVEEEEHKCLVCGESFPQQLSLLRHQKQQHAGERAFVCPECGRGFSLKHNLIIHQRIHTGEKPFGCSVCGKRFSLKQNLLTHQRVHSRERPFSCPACGKSFREQRLLLAHQKGDCGTSVTETQGEPGQQRMHTRGRARAERERGESLVQRPLRVKPQEKPHQNGAVFQCRQCGANFSCKSGLLGHQRIHREERPLQNDEGRRRCSPRETPPPPSQRRLAGDDPFQCLTCGKSFSQKGSLTAHRKCHLGEEMLS